MSSLPFLMVQIILVFREYKITTGTFFSVHLIHLIRAKMFWYWSDALRFGSANKQISRVKYS